VLTVDLVRARRRGDRLVLSSMDGRTRKAALEIASRYLAIAGSHEGLSRAEFKERCAEVPVESRHRKLADGLFKLVTDRCEFAVPAGIEPLQIRRRLFEVAAEQRRSLNPRSRFDRRAVMQTVARELELDANELDRRLYGDLKAAHVLGRFDPCGPDRLLEAYTFGQGQAVLLRATRVQVKIRAARAGAYRRLFHKLKFLRLMHVIESLPEGGYRVVIDGPFSLFRSVTKYGLQLALLLPALEECGPWTLDAEVLWGRPKERLAFSMRGGPSTETEATADTAPWSDDLRVFVERFTQLGTGWAVAPAERILEIPGHGLCVPDLSFTRESDGSQVFLEVMGFWSRAAVWRRVELVEAGLTERIVFAVSQRLRVSEEVLGEDLPGSLYVYKGVMSARKVAERIEALAERPQQGTA
jgi:predicted nuclease of restriction endonuclease-like RecB superfamily